MNDRLALAVGKIILAWGRLDQNLHFLIRAMERGLKEPHSLEGRFTERRKIFRRLCMRLALSNEEYERQLDQGLAQLVKLERKRGRIAHGFAGPTDDGAQFLSVPEAFANSAKPEIELLGNTFSFADLSQLQTDIDASVATLTGLMLDAASIWRQERDSTLSL
jgi:hypothetical protein